MSMPLVAITQAIITALRVNLDLTALVAARIYDVPPQQASVFPMITFGDMSAIDAGTKNKPYAEYSFAIDAWSEYEGRLELMQMTTAIYDTLHEVRIAGTILCRCDGYNFVSESDAATRHAVISVRVLVGF